MWRCPHCGTPQAETARCWVCRRSSTACGTCRNFRRSVAGSLGYCGLDRRRQPLVGDEIRACWEAWPGGEATVIVPLTIQPGAPTGGRAHPIEFVEVGAGSTVQPTPAAGDLTPADEPAALSPGPILPVAEPGWSLWGDTER
jgi:hypothetical protein